MDYEILTGAGIASMPRQNGALGGLIYGLRSNTFVMGFCEDIAKICPQAVIHNSTNPLARVACPQVHGRNPPAPSNDKKAET